MNKSMVLFSISEDEIDLIDTVRELEYGTINRIIVEHKESDRELLEIYKHEADLIKRLRRNGPVSRLSRVIVHERRAVSCETDVTINGFDCTRKDQLD